MIREAFAQRSQVASQVGVYGVIAFSAFAIGGTRADVQLAAASLMVLTALAVVVSPPSRRTAVPWPAWFFMGLAGMSGLQVLPLPMAVLQWLSPRSAALY